MTYLVGLTGGIGSGKSVAAEMFARRGIAVVDTDAIAHELTAPEGAGVEPIRDAFGSDYITSEGALDRPRMRALVFQHPPSKRKLERILHPRIRVECARRIAAARSPYVIMVVPLLVEGGANRGIGSARYRRIAVVDCPEDLQVERVMQRSRIPEEEVRRIIATQAARETRFDAADDVIDNSGTLADLEAQVDRLHRMYLMLSQDKSLDGG